MVALSLNENAALHLSVLKKWLTLEYEASLMKTKYLSEHNKPTSFKIT